jgi:uncharacterized lipoprotein YbaY
VVALVRGSARATESSIVASEIDRDISAVPVSFNLGFDPADIDSSVTYTLQATIVDGANAWVTGKGVPVLTKGNPSEVDITLAYRPDLLKGAVSGQISAVGLHPSTSAYSMTVVVDPATGDSLGIDVQTVANGLPQAFAVPYTITDVDPAKDYVATAEVVDSGQSWRNDAGVPVLTKGNPKTAVQVVVTPVVFASPSPTATPAPSAAPEPTGRDSGNLLGIIILIVIIGAIAAFFIARGRNEDGGGAGAGAAAAAGTADATEATEATEATVATEAEEPPTDAAPQP